MPRLIQMTVPPPIRQIVAIRGGNQETKPVAAAKIVKARNKMAMGPKIQASMRLYLFTVDPPKGSFVAQDDIRQRPRSRVGNDRGAR